MSRRNVALIGLVALLPAAIISGCSSSTDPENSGGAPSGTAGGHAGTTTNSAGGSPGASGTSTSAAGNAAAGTNATPAGSAGTCATNPDASCVSNSTAKEGAICTQDCMVSCGHNMLGTKTCTCAGGLFDNCSCPRPAAYMGAPTAPLCPTPDHMTAGLNDMPCEVEWDECIGADATSGKTKQGCACLKDGAALTWTCGSSNQWYTLAP